jgi:hypothetical protein
MKYKLDLHSAWRTAFPEVQLSLESSFTWSPASLRAWTTGYSVVIIPYVIGWFSDRCVAAVDAGGTWRTAFPGVQRT